MQGGRRITHETREKIPPIGMATRYRRVPQTEPEERVDADKKRRAERVEKITAKIHALIWIGISFALIYYSNAVELLSDPLRTNRWALNIAVASLAVVFGIFLYLAMWLPYVAKVTIPWEIYCPNMIPIATGASVVSFISFIVTFWPAWGFLSPLFVSIVTIGTIFTAAFIPWPC